MQDETSNLRVRIVILIIIAIGVLGVFIGSKYFRSLKSTDGFTPIPLGDLANRSIAQDYHRFPSGSNHRFEGYPVPFHISLDMWEASGQDWRVIFILEHLEIRDPKKIHLLMNLAHGEGSDETTEVRVKIGGEWYPFILSVGTHLREWRIGAVKEYPQLVVETTSPQTQEVWWGFSSGEVEERMVAVVDAVQIDLSEYEGLLQGIAVLDYGGDLPLTRLIALTVEADH